MKREQRSLQAAEPLILRSSTTPALQLNRNAHLMLDGYIAKAEKMLPDIDLLFDVTQRCSVTSSDDSALSDCLRRAQDSPGVNDACKRLATFVSADRREFSIDPEQVTAPLWLIGPPTI
jgi:hypothetical protein